MKVVNYSLGAVYNIYIYIKYILWALTFYLYLLLLYFIKLIIRHSYMKKNHFCRKDIISIVYSRCRPFLVTILAYIGLPTLPYVTGLTEKVCLLQ